MHLAARSYTKIGTVLHSILAETSLHRQKSAARPRELQYLGIPTSIIGKNSLCIRASLRASKTIPVYLPIFS